LLRGISVRQVGSQRPCDVHLIFSHFFNHALGNISYETMESWLRYHFWWWRIPLVNYTLYTAAMIHFSLGPWALYQRRHFRYTAIEITQLVLGLSIPLWLASHFGAVRLSGALYGLPPPLYAGPLYAYWVARPHMIAVQFILLTVAWTHACIGLYFWLRLKSFFSWAAPIFLAIAVLMPPLAMIGAHHAGREVAELGQDPAWRKENLQASSRAAQGYRQHHALLCDRYAAAIVLVRGAWRTHDARAPARPCDDFHPDRRCACRRA
jgi:adenylate cyclase